MTKILRCMYCNTKLSWVEVEDIKSGQIIQTLGCKTCWTDDEKFMSDYLFGRVRLIM